MYRTWPLGSFSNWITGRPLSLHYSVFTTVTLSSKSPPWCTPFIINAGRHISVTWCNSTPQNLVVASSVPPLLTQLLLCGHGPSSGSAPSQSVVQVFGTRLPHTIRNLHSAPAFRKALKTHLFLQLSTFNALSVDLHWCRRVKSISDGSNNLDQIIDRHLLPTLQNSTPLNSHSWLWLWLIWLCDLHILGKITSCTIFYIMLYF